MAKEEWDTVGDPESASITGRLNTWFPMAFQVSGDMCVIFRLVGTYVCNFQ